MLRIVGVLQSQPTHLPLRPMGSQASGGRQHEGMQVSLASLLLAALLPLQALAQPLGLEECRGLRARRNQLAAEAMQAEIALVLATRRRLCPQQEALAEQANANAIHNNVNTNSAANRAGADQSDPPARTGQVAQAALPDLDYTAYLQCRRRAEQLLQRNRAILYTNQRGFTFYTLDGARLARDADGVQRSLTASCVSKNVSALPPRTAASGGG